MDVKAEALRLYLEQVPHPASARLIYREHLCLNMTIAKAVCLQISI